mmetsp:Transcript_13249/g.21347  ORF Transcript_13249/g.21347 Transcript_13249/m.21347 type:complete len:113 (+) Transcript_13249:525-863(+)
MGDGWPATEASGGSSLKLRMFQKRFHADRARCFRTTKQQTRLERATMLAAVMVESNRPREPNIFHDNNILHSLCPSAASDHHHAIPLAQSVSQILSWFTYHRYSPDPLLQST